MYKIMQVHNFTPRQLTTNSWSRHLFMYLLVNCLDTDECESTPCARNAECTNTIGSFNCICSQFFMGDGFDCAGYYNYIIIIIFMSTCAMIKIYHSKSDIS